MRKKIVIIGAGGVGTSAALFISQLGNCDIDLVDINGDLAKGKSCDLTDFKGFTCFSNIVRGTRYIKKTIRGADIVTYQVYKILQLPRERIFGMGQGLDTARLRSLLALYFGVNPCSITTYVIGQHGKYMVPLWSRTLIGPEYIENLVKKEVLLKLKKELVERGATIVSFIKTGSATVSPGAGIAELVRAILYDEHKVIPVSFVLKGEYGVRNISIGYPCVISATGASPCNFNLQWEEKESFKEACMNVKELLKDVLRL